MSQETVLDCENTDDDLSRVWRVYTSVRWMLATCDGQPS